MTESIVFLQGSMPFIDIIKSLISWNYANIDYALYSGLIPLICLIILLIPIKHKLLSKHLRIWIYILSFVSIFAILGENNPLYKYIHYVPFFGNIRVTSRYVVLLVIAMIISLTFIINWLLSKRKRLTNFFVIGLGLLLFIDLNSRSRFIYVISVC